MKAPSGHRDQSERRTKIEGQLAIARRFGWSSRTTLKKYIEEDEDFPVRTEGVGKPRYWAWADEIDEWVAARRPDGAPAAARVADLEALDEPTSASTFHSGRTLLASGAGAALALAGLAVAAVLLGPRLLPVQSARVLATGEIEVSHRGLPWNRRIRGPWGSVGRDALNPDKPAVLLLDSDGDGRKEIAYDHRPLQMESQPGRLFLLEGSGAERWDVGYQRSWPNDPRISGRFSNARLRQVRRPSGPQILAVAAHFSYYPSRVLLVRAADGTLVDEYLHPGALQEPLVLDEDGDGFDDLVLLPGQNNPFEGDGHATMAILPLPFADREAEPQNVLGAENSKEQRYLVFPNPLVVWLEGRGAHLRNVAASDSTISVEVHVSEQVDLGSVNQHAVTYRLDRRSWSAGSVSLTDWYRRDLQRRIASGELVSDVVEREKERLRSFLDLPTAPDGNSRLFPLPDVLSDAGRPVDRPGMP